MWGTVLFTLIVSTSIAGCWCFGCCGVLKNMLKTCGITCGVCLVTAIGVLVLLTMVLTIAGFFCQITGWC
jgi:hypothetical protein